MSVTYRITLDLAKETDNAIYGLKVGETGEKIIKVALNENGKALQFDAGESVQLQIKKPDGNIILKDATRVNNLCTFSFSGTNTQQLTAVAGECEAEVVVFGDNFNKSCRFSLFVEEGVISEDEIESTSIYADLEEAKERYESIVQKAVKKDIIQNIFGYISGNDLIVNYYGYSNDNIAFRTLTADVTSINDSLVYLYQDTSNNWAVSFETPSSYNLAPAPIGKVKSYWIGNGTVKHFYPLNTVDICHDFYSNFSQIYATKQNAEQGKGLSTNDFTNELKATLENIAQTFITNTVNNLTNYYLKSETYSKSEVNQLIGAIPKFKIEVVNQLPTTDISTATVYLLTTGAESQNLYTEYIYVNNAWEKLGTQTVDLTGYATQTWVGSQIADFLTATEVSNVINTALSQYYDMNDIDDMLNRKVNTVSGKGLSTEDYTTAEKAKLNGIETGANKTVVDSVLSSTSTNPVQNNVVKEALDEKEDAFAVGQGLDMTTVSDNRVLQVEASDDGGIGFDENLKLKVKFDGDTIQTNISGQLEVNKDEIARVDYVDTELAKKVDKQSWTTLLTATTTEDAVFQLDDTSAGVDLDSYSEIEVIINLPSALTGRPHFNWYYNGSYTNDVVATLNAGDCRYTVMRFKKYYGLWWAECIISDTPVRLNITHKSVYRDGVTNLVMASFEGARIFISRGSPAVNDLPSGTKIIVRGLK